VGGYYRTIITAYKTSLTAAGGVENDLT